MRKVAELSAAFLFGGKHRYKHSVILGPDPRIQSFQRLVDGRVEPDHDGGEAGSLPYRLAIEAMRCG